MKQKMMKVLGVTALGAALTVTAAGVASAAPLVPSTTDVLSNAPVGETANTLTGGNNPVDSTEPLVDRLSGASLPL